MLTYENGIEKHFYDASESQMGQVRWNSFNGKDNVFTCPKQQDLVDSRSKTTLNYKE